MKKCLSIIVMVTITFSIANCSNGKSNSNSNSNSEPPVVAQSPEISRPAASGYTGTVIETMNTAGYTYVHVDTGKEKVWAAAPECQVKVGDKVTVPQGAPMKNYHSKTLDRTFDVVYFVGAINKPGEGQTSPAGSVKMPSVSPGKTPAIPLDLSNIKKPENGKTVEEIYSQKTDLAGKQIILRGKVVKFSPEIMGKNWIHVQDGTGTKGTNDLTVTSSVVVKTGDTILVEGKVVKDKDFGYGYKYDVIIFKRNMYPKFNFSSVCIGADWVGRTFLTNLICHAVKFKIFENEYLTFHLGDDRVWKNPAYNDYSKHNQKELHKILLYYKSSGLLTGRPLPEKYLHKIECALPRQKTFLSDLKKFFKKTT